MNGTTAILNDKTTNNGQEENTMERYMIRENTDSKPMDYFDGDCFTEKAGDYCCYLFIVNPYSSRSMGLNGSEYKNVQEKAMSIIDGFDFVKDNGTDFNGKKYTYKRVMEENGYKYNPTFCNHLREWFAADPDVCKTEDIAAFLTITTGKKWDVKSVYGYCQGDYAEVVFCEKYYSNPEIEGEIWLGCYKEYGVIELDEDGEEVDSCWGYFVADSQVSTTEEAKKLVCEWAGISPENTYVYVE